MTVLAMLLKLSPILQSVESTKQPSYRSCRDLTSMRLESKAIGSFSAVPEAETVDVIPRDIVSFLFSSLSVVQICWSDFATSTFRLSLLLRKHYRRPGAKRVNKISNVIQNRLSNSTTRTCH